jgi:hypothetical protein
LTTFRVSGIEIRRTGVEEASSEGEFLRRLFKGLFSSGSSFLMIGA